MLTQPAATEQSARVTDAAETINRLHTGTWAERIGLELLTATRDEVTAKLVVRPDHCQPQGIVHGGVYCAIVETLASVGAALDAMPHGKNVVGLENQTSFVRATRAGAVLACRATPVTRGRRTQLWDVVVSHEDGHVAATGRVRLLVLDRESDVAGAKLPERPHGA